MSIPRPSPRNPSRHFARLLFLLFPLFVGLGVWQLHRAEEKREWRAVVEQNLRAPPIPVLSFGAAETLKQPAAAHRKVEISGRFDNTHQYFLDNQAEHGKSGYWVLTPLRLDEHGVFLVNRGWVSSGLSRSHVPDVTVGDQSITLTGRLARPYRPALLLSHTEPEALRPGRTRLQYVDVGRIESELGAKVFPLILELDPASPFGYQREWSPPIINAERHTAYAVQWFSLAVLFLFIHWRAYRQQMSLASDLATDKKKQ